MYYKNEKNFNTYVIFLKMIFKHKYTNELQTYIYIYIS